MVLGSCSDFGLQKLQKLAATWALAFAVVALACVLACGAAGVLLGATAAPAFASENTTITNLAGTEARDTALEISKAAFTDGETTNAIIARDDDFADAMSSTGLAGQLNAPILLIDRNAGVSDALTAELSRLGVKNVYVIGGTGAIPADVATQLGGAYKTERVFGAEAADTSVECAKTLAKLSGVAPQYAVVAMSDNFQDALSMSSFAYKYKAPIILETSGAAAAERELPTGALSILNSSSAKVFIAGGTGALSEASVAAITTSKERLWGEDGYDTSNQIATYMANNNLLEANTVVIANGAQAAKGTDALAGAALAGKQNGVLLLTQGHEGGSMGAVDSTTVAGLDSQDTESFVGTHNASIVKAYTLGGSYVMPHEYQVYIKEVLDIALSDDEQTLLDALAAYDDLIEEYRGAVEYISKGEKDPDFYKRYPRVEDYGALSFHDPEDFFYVIKDINSDGTPELLLSVRRGKLWDVSYSQNNSCLMISDIWTYVNCEATHVGIGWARGYYQLCDDNVVRYDSTSDSVAYDIYFMRPDFSKVSLGNDSADLIGYNETYWNLIDGVRTMPDTNAANRSDQPSVLYRFNLSINDWEYQGPFASSSKTYVDALNSLEAELQQKYPLGTSIEWLPLAS